tara:strand:+ start:9043 stop:9627 length:585 start_codon:yes stop_codon:yes gene_type:complete
MAKKWDATKIVKKKIRDLIPYERNSKIHPDSQIKQLVKSIQEWGWTVPLLVDEKNNVISGHGRLYAAEELKMKTVPCIVAKGWTDQQRRAYVIADNKLAEGSIWNEDLLHAEMTKLLDENFDLDLLAFDFDTPVESYAPNILPMVNYRDVNEGHVQKAADVIDGRFGEMSGQRENAGIEVVCPHCTGSFRFSGA